MNFIEDDYFILFYFSMLICFVKVINFHRFCVRHSTKLMKAVHVWLTKCRGLRMLSLVLGSEITDASVAAISSSYPNLELLDLSGYVLCSSFNLTFYIFIYKQANYICQRLKVHRYDIRVLTIDE